MKPFATLWKSFSDFFRDGGLILAASISYFAMMAMAPFLLFVLKVFGYFLGRHPEFYKFLLNGFAELFPTAAKETTNDIMELVSYRGVNKVGLLLYGFLSYQLFAALENALNVVFKVKQGRHIIFSILISLAVTTMMIALLLVSFAASTVVPFLNELKPWLPAIKIGRVTAFLLRYVVPFILVFLTSVLLYKFIPRTSVGIRAAFRGGLFTAVFLEMAKYAFTPYVGHVAHLGRIYGSLTAVVVFLLWMFYSSCIFLIGAELVHNSSGQRRAAKDKR